MKQDIVSKTLLDIKESIGTLDGKVDGINKRLDKTNGTIARHEIRLNQVEAKTDIMNGEIKGIAILGSIVTIIIAIITITRHLL